MSKYQENYNYHDWSKFEVKDAKNKPTGPHFAAVLFELEQRSEQDYDKPSVWRTHSVSKVTYFAFPDKETLQEWVIRAKKDNKEFFFFEVKSLGSAQVKVDLMF